MKRGWIGFLASGFYCGLSPVAPGTAGSVLGVLWTALLLWPGSLGWYYTLTAAQLFAAVWICGKAERLAGEPDPRWVVLDEMSAMPCCFAGLVALHRGPFLTPGAFLSPSSSLQVLVIFAFFRLFDIWKPWPIRQSQSLPGGWGVVLDDVLAAVYVNGVTFVLALSAAS